MRLNYQNIIFHTIKKISCHDGKLILEPNVILQQHVCSDNKIQSILKKHTENKELLVFTLCFYINRNRIQTNTGTSLHSTCYVKRIRQTDTPCKIPKSETRRIQTIVLAVFHFHFKPNLLQPRASLFCRAFYQNSTLKTQT